ncbi:trigger factor [Dissulfurispira thermophila]|uniref:Trigger factor n=2 Tax=root TaxID=1 RepID=A0A7G1GZQ0_9BACT|nr:trigger factor [Dissulfurispira thermophila]BCB95552.1 trigger factor [Dissulfurispira thermophila]
MLKALEDISSTKKRLKIEVPAEAIESEIKKGLNEAQKRARIPGFRPGKAPMYLIEKKFGKEIEADVLEKIIPEYYLKAIKEADITPVSRPVMEDSFEFKRSEPISMTISVEVRPKIENLNYENLTVKEVPVKVEDEEIEDVLNRLAEEKALYESVDDAVNTGDLVTIDYSATIPKSQGLSGDIAEETVSENVVLKIGSGHYPQEFFDGIIGKKKDEKFIIEATFPDDSPTMFAGKRPKFEITIKDIKRRNIPPIDDEFAKDMGFENIGQLRDKVRENILAAKNRDAERIKQREILDKLLELHSFEVPEVMLNSEINEIISEIRAIGKDTRTDEEIREEVKPNAEKSVRASILLELIGEREGIKVSDEDMKEEILNTAMRTYVSPENIIKYYTARDGSLEGLKQSVFEKKVLKFLLNKAKIQE